MDNLFFDDFELDSILTEEDFKEDGKYTAKVTVPQYVPNPVYCPSISEMMDTTKYEELVTNINASNVDDDVKRFLRLAASRHIVFNYAKIADYYAHADKELQKLMEDSALVIIDINDALANGFAKLDYRLMDIAKKSKEALEEQNER